MSLIAGTVGLRRVFDDPQAVSCRNFQNRSHLRRLPVEMNGNQCTRSGCDPRLDLVHIDRVGAWIDIDEYRRCSSMDNGFGCRDKTIRGENDLIAFADIQRFQRQYERIRTIRDANRVADFTIIREAALESLHGDTTDESSGVENIRPHLQQFCPQQQMFGLQVHEGNFHPYNLLYSASGIGKVLLFSTAPRTDTPPASSISFALRAVSRRVHEHLRAGEGLPPTDRRAREREHAGVDAEGERTGDAREDHVADDERRLVDRAAVLRASAEYQHGKRE